MGEMADMAIDQAIEWELEYGDQEDNPFGRRPARYGEVTSSAREALASIQEGLAEP
jgi:hypothetical protein